MTLLHHDDGGDDDDHCYSTKLTSSTRISSYGGVEMTYFDLKAISASVYMDPQILQI